MNRNSFWADRPMEYEELILAVIPEKIRNPDHPKHKKVVGLIQAMARHLEDARMVSTIPEKEYVRGYSSKQSQAQTQFRIAGIQEQMSAIRFRLDIHDYGGETEKEILRDRLYSLYDQARVIDPDGVKRFERTMDKKIRKARTR